MKMGWILSENLGSLGHLQNTPIIAISAFLTSNIENDVFEAGCNAFISKPILDLNSFTEKNTSIFMKKIPFINDGYITKIFYSA